SPLSRLIPCFLTRCGKQTTSPPSFLLLREHACHSRDRDTFPGSQRDWVQTLVRLCWFDGHSIPGEHAVQRGRACGGSTAVELPEVIPFPPKPEPFAANLKRFR